MNTSTEKIKAELIEKLKPIFGNQVRKSELTKVQKYIDHYMKSKSYEFYKKSPVHVGSFLMDWVNSQKETNPDSRAEGIFYDLLLNKEIPFKFQYKVGPYRADFLIADFLDFEIDGAQHHRTTDYDRGRDKYFKRMGYEVMRIPLGILVVSPEAVLKDIKELMEKNNAIQKRKARRPKNEGCQRKTSQVNQRMS